ncbi:MAG TPA: hypothetical protein VHC69_10295 [Polyangiaceae bacterium]|nr:hypothetical protein [Polyangiaceae bacterium]
MTRRSFALVAAVCLWQLGCGEIVVRSGLPAGVVARGYRERWHDSVLFGTVESARREPLDEICPHGWSEVRASSSFLTGALAWGTLGIYTPTTVTVVCAAPPGVYIGAPGETPLAAPCR